jgi:chromosome segregation ATPase
MTWTTAIIIGALGIVLGLVTVFVMRRRSTGGDPQEIQKAIEDVNAVASQLDGIEEKIKQFVPKSQLDDLAAKMEEVKAEMANENWRLKEIEAKLDNSQKLVEDKEYKQQAVKSSKEEDEKKLTELLANYNSISEESIALEQKLAASMKNLDAMMSDIKMTEEQKAVLTALSEALLAAGSRLRELITEYQNVNERLDALKNQHAELEEEYTKLVEQQLGE